MLKLFSFFAALAFMPVLAAAQNVGIQWTATPDTANFTNVVYLVYTAPPPFSIFTKVATVTTTTATVTVTSIVKCYVTAALKDPTDGSISCESAPSNVINLGTLRGPANLGKQ